MILHRVQRHHYLHREGTFLMGMISTSSEYQPISCTEDARRSSLARLALTMSILGGKQRSCLLWPHSIQMTTNVMIRTMLLMLAEQWMLLLRLMIDHGQRGIWIGIRIR